MTAAAKSLSTQKRRNAQHPKASPPKLHITTGIQGELLGMVGVPVDFDDERGPSREEVDDVITDDLLTPKLHPKALAADG